MDVASVVITAIVSLCAGGLAGAIYTNWQTSRRGSATAKRTLGALLADVGRINHIVQHNIETVSPIEQDRPRAFIKFPTQSYELLLFSGQISVLSEDSLITPLMDYLQQAYHVNSMINLFEQIESQTAATTHSPLWTKKQMYLQAIVEHCTRDMSTVVEELKRGLATAGRRLSRS